MPSSASFLLRHFDRLAEAPGGIAKLRALILHLAVQGKLVDQDQKDRSALELAASLNRRLDYDFELPWSIPKNWAITTVEALTGNDGFFGDGDWVESKDQDPSGDVRLTQLADVGLGFYRDRSFRFMTRSAAERLRCTFLQVGDVLIARMPDPLGRACVFPGDKKPCVTVVDVAILRVTKKGISPEYVVHALNSAGFATMVLAKAAGTTRSRISRGNLAKFPFPLPPLAEQRRIVAKVEELMGLCDALEAAQQEREAVRTRLRTSALHQLASPDSDSNPAAFVLQNLPRFTAASEDFDDIRQSVLQLAIAGKLSTEKSGEDGDALLQQIRKRKLALIASGKAPKEKPAEAIDSSALPFEVPSSWTWTRVAWISCGLDYGTSEKSERSNLGVPVVSMGNLQNGRILLENLKRVPDSTEGLPDLYLEAGDILFNRTNSAELVGKTGIYEGQSQSFTFASYLIRLRIVTEFADPRFVIIATNAPYFRATQIAPEIVQQCGQANVNGTKLANFLIPLPPLAEQRRIVAKVDELMAVLDALEATLTTAHTTAEKLLAATIARLHEPKSKPTEVVDFHSSPEFIRASLAAEIADRLREDRYFGQTKLQKILYLAEHLFQLPEIDSRHVRFPRGPHDPDLVDQVERKMKQCEWFDAVPRDNGKGKEYLPLAHAGQHRTFFEKQWPKQAVTIRSLIDEMKNWSTERCERFATVYAAWNDLLHWKGAATDDAILEQVLKHWHPDKLKFSQSQWEEMLTWMKRERRTPTGFGRATQSAPQAELFPV